MSARRIVTLAAALAGLLSTTARAELDIGRLVAGRTMYLPNTWAVDSFSSYTADRLRDPGSDRAQAELELERGQSDRLGFELGLGTTRARRDRLKLGNLGLGVRGLALEEPFELALQAEWAPSLQGGRPEWETEAETIRNFGDHWSAVIQYSGEIEPGRHLEHRFIAGPLYRVGLQGLVGVQGVYDADGALAVQATFGGSVGRRVYLALTPRAGLNRRAPSATLMIELHAIFGPIALGAWGLR